MQVILGKFSLHVFCNASAKAFGTVAYSVNLDNLTSNLLVVKACVDLPESLTMPKLESTAVFLGCKLAQTVMNHDSFQFSSCTIWSDSEDYCKDKE